MNSLEGSQDSVIKFTDVGKRYKLYQSRTEQILDLLGLFKIVGRNRKKFQEFQALQNCNFHVQAGERIGIIGRNGAGKSTLLKLISGAIEPTEGEVSVNGKVQALFDSGLGFHPEFTGYENIKASLLYNNLSDQEASVALKDVIDFVELGDFLHQPIKNYSLGMKARLAFATSTAINPRILIVDEVLGAGDAYFAAKSVARMMRFVKGGTTLLLVSHSMQQILQFCNKVLWLEQGELMEFGDALTVIRKYESYIRNFENNRLESENIKRQKAVNERGGPEKKQDEWKEARWPGKAGLKIHSCQMFGPGNRKRWVYETGAPLTVEMELIAESAGEFKCKFVFAIYTLDGRLVSLHCSALESLSLKKDERKVAYLGYTELLLGDGEYVASAALYERFDFDKPNESVLFDLLDRIFFFKVHAPRKNDTSLVFHPCIWRLPSGREMREIDKINLETTVYDYMS